MGGMRKLRWAMDSSGFWELDMETPATMEGTARPVPGLPLPLGLSRGIRLSRPKQLEFMHRFMASPLVPSYTPDQGVSLHHVHTLHLHNNWSASLMERFHLRKFFSAAEEEGSGRLKGISWVKDVGRKLFNACSFGFGSEFLLTPDTLVLIESYKEDDKNGNRTKALLHHKLPQHNLTIEAASPGLFVDKSGVYWDVPSLMSIDLASNPSDSGSSYHLYIQQNSGHAKNHKTGEADDTPPSLLPGLCAKSAVSYTKNVDIWRTKEGKLKMVQPYDIFLSDPHVSLIGSIGSVFGTYIGDGLKISTEDGAQPLKPISLRVRGSSISLMADFFASVLFTAQHGNFQRLLFDLSRISARLDFPSVASSLKGAINVAHGLYNSKQFNMEAVASTCPKVTISLQQQIAGPFSFRAESRFTLDPTNPGSFARVDDSVFAIEYAMQVLGSARATAWYSTKNQEAMVELRFFET